MKNREDHLIEINKSNLDLDNFYENKFQINLNRVAFIFITICILIILYSTRVIYLSSKTLKNYTNTVNKVNRADIIDRNGNFISKSVFTTNVGIDPKLIKNKKKFLLKLQYTFPEKNFEEIKKKVYGQKFFI